jgi:hypothetical protein
MRALSLDPRALPQEQEAEARRLALRAEKGMLQEASRRGWLEEDEWRALAARIDVALTRLQERGPQ